MNAPRRNNVVALPDSHEIGGIGGAVKKHLNTALTVILFIAAIAMFIRWRVRTAEAAKLSIAAELGNARTLVRQLQPSQLPMFQPAAMVSNVQSWQNGALLAITNVLNSSESDVHMRAESLQLKGDLYWELANLPAVPGSTTQPSLQWKEAGDTLLQKSWDAYQELIKNSTYADQHEQIAAAHLGLAAIAENRGDWGAAQKELEAVKGDASALPALVDAASVQLAELPELQKKLYLAPASGIAPMPLPMGPVAPVMPPTTQAAVPMSPISPISPMPIPSISPLSIDTKPLMPSTNPASVK